MNVSRNAYFTSEYLDKRNARSPRISRTPSDQDRMSSSPDKEQLLSRVSSPKLDSPDHLDEVLTPAQLNYLHKPKPKADYSAYYSKRAPQKPRHSQHRYYLNDDDDEDDSASFRTEDLDSIIEYQQRKPLEFNGYYIDQQKKYNAARDLKPKMFTHKTFMDVFEKDQDDRINPADIVFSESEKSKSLRQRITFNETMKKFRKKIDNNKKDLFSNYNSSHENRDLNDQNKDELFVNSVSDESDTDTPAFTDQPSNRRLRKAMKKKWQNAKRKVGDDYYENYQRALAVKQMKQLKKNNSGSGGIVDYGVSAAQGLDLMSHTTIGDSTDRLSASATKTTNSSYEGFHPLWAYILSWLVYERSEEDKARQGKIVELNDHENNFLTSSLENESTSKKKSAFKNYKALVRNWNTPASAFFDGKSVLLQNETLVGDELSRSGDSSYPDYLEISDDDMGDEIVYNSQLKHLNLPPTSADAMLVKNEWSSGKIHEGGPQKIISNLNALLKTIKVMKIIFAPIDIIAENFPSTQTFVILTELAIFIWILYELSLLIDALCLAVRAVCAPMIAVGRFMNKIM